MSKTPLSPSQWVSLLSERSGVSADHVRALLQAQAELACEVAKTGVPAPIPGIGLLKLIDLPKRTMVLRFGPNSGEKRMIPPFRKLKFRVDVLAKAVVSEEKIALPDLFSIDWYVDLEGLEED